MNTSCIELAESWLAASYELVAEGWCQGAEARDAFGAPVEPENRRARAWSATGALTRVWRSSDEVDDSARLEAFARANLALTAATRSVPSAWNDHPSRRKSHVLEAVLTAVSLVRLADPAVDDRFVQVAV